MGTTILPGRTRFALYLDRGATTEATSQGPQSRLTLPDVESLDAIIHMELMLK